MLTDEEIRGCFGAQDFLFAVHALEADRAFALLGKLRAQKAEWLDVRDEFERFLRDHGCDRAHIEEQIASVRRHFAAWLYGRIEMEEPEPGQGERQWKDRAG
jgi:hypothetical protein